MMTTFITHPSVRMKGTEANYQPEQCFDGGCSDHPPHMHCPFCVKSDCYTDPVILKAHYRVKHVDKGIEFAGLKILRCCAQCEIVGVIKGEKRFKGAHWHCYKCRNGFNRRDEAIKHYKTHFRNPQTTFQIQIAQDTNQPVTQGFETEEAAASIPVDTFTVHSVNSSLPVVTSYTQAGSEMMHRGVEDMVTGVGAIETVGLSDTQTIMIIQDETHGMHDTSQDLSNASSLVNDSGDDHSGDPGLEMQVKELQQRVVQLEQELLDRDAVIRDLQAKVNASKAREQELMDQLSVPTSESLQELCTSLQTQHSELLRNQLKLVQQAVLKNHNQNKKSQTKMIIINPVGTSLSAASLMNSGQDVINSVLNSGLTLHGSQALSVSLAGTLTNTASLSAGKTRVTDTDGSTGEGHEGSTVDDHHVKEADFMSKDLMEQHFSHAAERMAQTDTERRPARKKAKLQSQSDVELQNA